MRPAFAPLMLLALGACAGTPTRDEGVATLDALSARHAACEANGGAMRLKPEGDPQSIDAYACERK